MGVFDCFTADWQMGDYSQQEMPTVDLASPEHRAKIEAKARADGERAALQEYDAALGDVPDEVYSDEYLYEATQDFLRGQSVSVPLEAFQEAVLLERRGEHAVHRLERIGDLYAVAFWSGLIDTVRGLQRLRRRIRQVRTAARSRAYLRGARQPSQQHKQRLAQ